jgi:hypothetical protein
VQDIYPDARLLLFGRSLAQRLLGASHAAVHGLERVLG